jgi:hypothetical protein
MIVGNFIYHLLLCLLMNAAMRPHVAVELDGIRPSGTFSPYPAFPVNEPAKG